MVKTSSGAVLLALASAIVAGCGSALPARVAQSGQTASTPTATSAPKPAATKPTRPVAPDPASAPAFVLEGQTEHDDKLKLEGRFGPVLTASPDRAVGV
jgi:hypothetical protein